MCSSKRTQSPKTQYFQTIRSGVSGQQYEKEKRYVCELVEYNIFKKDEEIKHEFTEPNHAIPSCVDPINGLNFSRRRKKAPNI